ncbi:MAG: ribonuclease P protein component [Rhodobiaceae bacterium]|nr:ribonuclease P protein component [Rhodobiaceae bacterium]
MDERPAPACAPPAERSAGVAGKLRRRAEFLHAQAGRKAVRPGFILRARQRRMGPDGGARAGLTVSRKVGGAVQRNRIKRRLREVLRAIAPERMRDGFDYVVIARSHALTQTFASLTRDMESAFAAVHGEGRSPRPNR